MKKIIGLISCLFLFVGSALAQEKIYLTTQKEPIECTVVEIGINEIKYKPADAEQLVISISKQDVVKIVYKSGRVQFFTDPLQDFSFYKGQKRWIAKVGLLSPAFGFTDLYVEKSIKPGKSLEFQANIIGLGKNLTYYNTYTYAQDLHLDQKGLGLGVGLKVLRMPDFELSNRRLLHILQGSYLKPSVNIGYYQRNLLYQDFNSGTYKTSKKGIVTSQLSITLGKQWILDNTISIEIYGMMGMGVDNYRSQQNKFVKDNGGGISYYSDETIPYSNFGYTRFGRGDVGITIGGGLKVGYLFNWKKSKDTLGGEAKMRERLNK